MNHLLLINTTVCILQFQHVIGPLVPASAVLSADLKICDSVGKPSNLLKHTVEKRLCLAGCFNIYVGGSQEWAYVWPVM